MNEIEIYPFKELHPGECFECGSPLYVIDSEMSLIALTRDGEPYSLDTVVKCIAKCPVCGHSEDMVRCGGKYLPADSFFYREFLKSIKETNTDRIKKLQAEARVNPLALEIKP